MTDKEQKMKNMERYLRVCTPPKDALRPIAGGRLKGKTDINPQWRIEAMTEEYGQYGVGWYYEVTGREFKEGANGEVAAFVDVLLYVRYGQDWCPPIHGTGGSMFVTNEKNGIYTSDEALKMATTDALSVAMKFLGIGADVYRGFDMNESKYDRYKEPEAPQKEEEGLPYLTEKLIGKGGVNMYQSAEKHMREGGKIEDIEARYRLTKKMKEHLLSL